MLRPLALAAAVACLVSMLAAGPASADTVDIHGPESCGTRHTEARFFLHPARSPWRLHLKVHHRPGNFGTLELRSISEPDRGLMWKFDQPWHWIWGDFTVDSPDQLPVGEYQVQTWSHNLAQTPPFCDWSLWAKTEGRGP